MFSPYRGVHSLAGMGSCGRWGGLGHVTNQNITGGDFLFHANNALFAVEVLTGAILIDLIPTNSATGLLIGGEVGKVNHQKKEKGMGKFFLGSVSGKFFSLFHGFLLSKWGRSVKFEQPRNESSPARDQAGPGKDTAKPFSFKVSAIDSPLKSAQGPDDAHIRFRLFKLAGLGIHLGALGLDRQVGLFNNGLNRDHTTGAAPEAAHVFKMVGNGLLFTFAKVFTKV